MTHQSIQLFNWLDIEKFKLAEDESIIIYEIPVENTIDFETSRERLLEVYKDVEIKMVRDSGVYWVKLFKK